MSNLTVQGKVEYWCKNCKHCETIKMVGMDTEYICSDPYDGMEKTLNGDSDVTCSMYEPRPNPTHVCYEQEVKVIKPGEKVDIPCTKISLLEHELEMDRLRREIYQLEKEKVAHMKGIERLKKSNNDLKGAYNHLLETLKRENEAGSNIVEENVKLEKEKAELIKASKRKDELIQDYRKKLKEVKEKYSELESRITDLTDTNIKLMERNVELVAQCDETYEEYKYWKERCHKAETDVTTLNSKVEVLDKRNTKLKQTIEDQDMTIKALLITIKEMCKED